MIRTSGGISEEHVKCASVTAVSPDATPHWPAFEMHSREHLIDPIDVTTTRLASHLRKSGYQVGGNAKAVHSSGCRKRDAAWDTRGGVEARQLDAAEPWHVQRQESRITYLEKRFRMRPLGVVSKKLIGDLKMAYACSHD